VSDRSASWRMMRLRDTVVDVRGGTWGDDPISGTDPLCVRVADFDRERLVVKPTASTLRHIEANSLKRMQLKKGDLLLEKSGGGEKQNVGAVVYWDRDDVAVCSNFIARVRCRGNALPRFLVRLHFALYAAGAPNRSTKQATGIQNLDVRSYLDEPICLPEIEEQELIIRYLDHAELRIAKAIATKQQVLELLRERRQSIVQATVLKGLAPGIDRADTGVAWLGSVPAHWRVVRARECFVERVEKSKEGAEELLSVSQYFGVRPTRHVRKQDSQMLSRAATLVGYKVVLADDLVVNTMLAWNGSMGASPIDGIVSPAYAVYRPLAGVDTKYFQYLLTTPLLKGVIRAWSSGIQDSRLRLYPNKFFQIAVPLPSFEEQKEISLYLDAQLKSSDEAALAVLSEIALLKEYRTRLVSDVVTGKLDVRDEAATLPEIDPMELATVAVGENGDDEEATDDD